MSRQLVRALTAGALFLTLAVPAQAQHLIQLKNAGHNVAAFGYYVGPYGGLDLTASPGGPTIDLLCVDFLHEVSLGQKWWANITPLWANLNGVTRGGNAKQSQYRKAAWLYTQFALNPTSVWGQIHASIWQIMTPGAVGQPVPSSNYWITQANTHYLDNGASYYNRFRVITPTNMSDPHSAQEFLTTATATPEPAEVVLFGTGLGGLALLLLRRRRAVGVS